ncbi:hypothetical protein, conserved [Plasmodium vivax]|uniref:VIR protein n=1 Tax=Plasmodium vivax TaxID=5855 RepID=A0A1G4E987_PLAVI|nr:hypothetical protein, conserved [Plasmodium vivax]
MYNMSPLENQDHIGHLDTLSYAKHLHQNILQLGPSLQEEEDAQTEYPVFSMDNSQKDFCDMKTIRMEILD